MSDEDGAKYELTAEYVENTLLGDERTIRETVRQNRSLGEWVRNQIDRILAKLGNAEEQAAAKERQELRRIRDLYAKALKEKTASQGETDGKWRFEIDDSKMTVRLPEYDYNRLRDLIRHEKFRVYAQLLYAVQLQRGLHLLKLYAEEILDNRGTEVFTRAYELKDIKEIAPVAKGVHSKGGLTQATNAKSGYSVADLYALVKQHDRDFKALPSSKIGNADGTPKSAIFFEDTPYYGRNRSYRKTSFVNRQKRFFMERVTRLELATSTLARWRSTG